MSLDTDLSRPVWTGGGTPLFRWLPLVAALFCWGSLLRAAAWEGSDDFSSSTGSASKWQRWDHRRIAYQVAADGQLRCVFNNYESDAPWIWGKKMTKIPSAACWTVTADIQLPTSLPGGVNANRAKAGIGIIGLPYSSSRKRVLTLKVYRYFSEAYQAIKVDSNFGFGADDQDETYPGNHPNCRIIFTHDALRQKDTYRVVSLATSADLLDVEYDSELSVSPTVGLGAVVSGKKNWPSGNTTLGLDNWSVVENNPDPINLAVQSSSSRGVAYTVAVTNLDLINQRLTGTVALTVGTNSATLPITGSIDKNGFFVLTGKGTGSAKGFGCALLYDVATGTYRSNKNTVTAPKQKASRF